MSKLTDTQLIALSSATQREDGAVLLPKHLKGGSAAKVVKPLLAQKLVKEVRAKPDMPVWRRDQEAGRSYALVITRAGSAAINVEPAAPADDQPHAVDDASRPVAAESGRRSRKRKAGPHNKGSASSNPASVGAWAPRTGSKLALVVKMLGRVRGVSIDDLTAATDWLPHTTRSVINSLRNKGYRIETERNRDNKTVYRISDSEDSASHGRAA